MELKDIIKKDLIWILKENTKNGVINEIADVLFAKGYIKDKDKLKEMIEERERLMSTGIGLGIGVPHIRMEGVSEPVVAVGISLSGIKDYISIDNEPVRVVFMIVVDKHAHKEYIKLLAQVAEFAKNDSVRNVLFNSRDVAEIYDVLTK